MGRGRQKAKATRQARDMKYFSPATDLSALERELGKSRGHSTTAPSPVDVPFESDYSDYEDKYADDDDEDDQRRIS
ncbi:DUF3073 domain-containing protein [Paeniglutamicibacter psychrophenolicus]|jgi:hypothetical protein|uniref:DUF3073 domain-containing protein n=1 Tax=Paeniglutamicibacter psychrophenolicus TaxID=257454 RepID=UPI0027D86C79|nr:DUF3073 domain-containing protein [Paeniglutamicibacter psychrophenolicus]